MKWEVVIGLETHVQLQTQSKIFCGASTAFGSEPNTQADAVSLALPGVLPVLNREAVRCAIKFGLAIGADIAPRSVFARKNYFYPDLPKGYQISQYELPVVGKGCLTIRVPAANSEQPEDKVVNITRAHLEEDAGKSVHEDFHGMSGIDLNRAGTPLLEIVSEPDMRSAAEAVAYAKKLHELVQWIGICDGNMQEGSFRCDVNVSVRPEGSEKLGTRREIKNLNSFRFMQQAIEYETRWQIETLEDGGTIQQATVLFDPDSGETRAMRTKEEANDYRYFPDPDLLPLQITTDDIAHVKAAMPELPDAMKARFEQEYGLPAYDAATITASRAMADYFVAAAGALPKEFAKQAANWVMGSVAAKLNEESREIADCPVSPAQLAGLLKRIQDGTISGKIAKEVFDAMWVGEGDADAIIESKGLKQVSDAGEIEKIVDEVLAANAAMVTEYKAGKEKAFNSLVGQCMKVSKGKANPAQVNEILKKKLV
ncbi:MAG: Asp-tRNA(Asn)/Glu-tRNA(Gln) amidotransferase subunit GatB [Methylobacillus sp.]|jgi:aspartyl-tRNA(Asn)/glutamyl-tRNA(Gln) amidotransferase subunit B|nr:Asp-tRNA(Asn)/Glu-tRNA(Gln) amidotransferase subunit GatB [Methylobacillus sp.]